MRNRCNDKNAANYHNYGGRGIMVCDEWNIAKGYETFKEWALSNGYADNLTLDRIDVNGNYEPNNCRWATNKEQNRNKRGTIYITIDGVTKTACDWADECNISSDSIVRRSRNGVVGKSLLEDPFRRLVTYKGKKVTLQELSKLTGINYNTLCTRYRKGFKGEKLYSTKEELSSGKTVYQFLNGEIIGIYPSASEAGRQNNICISRIIECCNGTAKSAGGYKWQYKGD